MNILMFDGLLLFLLFMWTSADTAPGPERTGGSQVYANESRVNIQSRSKACVNLGGKCIKKKKDCPSGLPLETEPGRPYCSKRQRCCYPGPSCNLAWNYNEHRPLIMIRETKTIVPPVETTISDDPNRIPLGVKLVFACAGRSNVFNHIDGVHTKLHGECVAEDQFKVCVNNSPVYLDLDELSCSKPLFPSFIKQDNGISDDNGCDELGGQLYRQGYTYGDYHEFKDLEIDVCFTENEKTLCTSPNINGNETDYGAEDPTGRGTQAGNRSPTSSECGTDANEICRYTKCWADQGIEQGREGRCSENPIPKSTVGITDRHCVGDERCWIPNECPNICFISKHVCEDCRGKSTEEMTAKAAIFTTAARLEDNESTNTVFYSPNTIDYAKTDSDFDHITCNIKLPVVTFLCTRILAKWTCKIHGNCVGESTLSYPGHLDTASVKPKQG